MAAERDMFSISRVGPAMRRGLFAAGMAAAVMVAGLPAGAHTPESGLDPSVTLTVSPDDALTDGQNVWVSGTGFPANTAGLIRECGGSVAAPECDTVLSGFFITTATGDFPPTPMTVNRVITTFASTTYNCSVQACALVADAGGKSSRHHISFAGAGTSTPTTSATTVPGTTTAPGATTVPPQTTIPSNTTVPPPTTTPPTTTPPTTTPPLPIPNLLCAILQPISNLLGGLLNGLLAALGCPPPVVG